MLFILFIKLYKTPADGCFLGYLLLIKCDYRIQITDRFNEQLDKKRV